MTDRNQQPIDPAYALAVGAELADAAAACTTPSNAAHLRAIAACLRDGIAAQARGALADYDAAHAAQSIQL